MFSYFNFFSYLYNISLQIIKFKNSLINLTNYISKFLIFPIVQLIVQIKNFEYHNLDYIVVEFLIFLVILLIEPYEQMFYMLTN